MFAAVLDTCVLWPSLQRDFLLSMAVEGLYRPLWSEAILEELHRHEQRKLIDRGSEETAALAEATLLLRNLRGNFDDALVTGWEPLDGSFGLPDIPGTSTYSPAGSSRQTLPTLTQSGRHAHFARCHVVAGRQGRHPTSW